MKIFLTTFVLAIIIIISTITITVLTSAAFERDYMGEWNLSDKSSTIEAKSEHLNNFVILLEKNKDKDFLDNGKIFFQNQNSSFDSNLAALKTLAKRLEEIKGMDPASFQYNTAIQQITQQEQGEAGAMIGVFYDCYALRQHYIVCGFDGLIVLGSLGVMIIVIILAVSGVIEP